MDKSKMEEALKHDLSKDELEAVSGGQDRDWSKDGCWATVEYGSHCWSSDACWLDEIIYQYGPSEYKCPKCDIPLYRYKQTAGALGRVINHYRCKKCGYETTKNS